jgi:hypothetical protein
MAVALRAFPGMGSDAVSKIEVEVTRHPGRLDLNYTMVGSIASLLLPPFASGKRTDELWKHTCFEAFLRPAQAEAYFEFNFAPSAQWAAYGFSGVRTGMHEIDASPASIEAEQEGQSYTLKVSVDLSKVPELAAETLWRVNLSAVIEEKNGRKSYWALAHPAAKPDFHNPDCFVLELPAA